MTNEQYNLYDSINTYAIKTIIYQDNKNENLIFENFYEEPEDLWVFEILKVFNRLSDKKIYVDCNFFKFLIFKYIRGYKFIKKHNKKINGFRIDCEKFEHEIIHVFNTYLGTLVNIYYIIFRGKKNA